MDGNNDTRKEQALTPEEKQYLILFAYTDNYDSDAIKGWDIVQGRQETYETLKDLILNEEIDPIESFVLVETVTMAEKITVAEFMKQMRKFFFHLDGFDIHEYVDGLRTEQEEYIASLPQVMEYIQPAGDHDVGTSSKTNV